MLPERPTVLLVASAFDREIPARAGGGAASTHLLARELVKHGFGVRVLAFGSHEHTESWYFGETLVPLHFAKRCKLFDRFPFGSAYSFRRQFRHASRGAAIVHLYGPILIALLPFIRHRLAAKRTVMTLNGYAAISPDFSVMFGSRETYSESSRYFYYAWRKLVDSQLRSPVGRALIRPLLVPLSWVFSRLYIAPKRYLDRFIAISESIATHHRERNFRNVTVIPNMIDTQMIRGVQSKKKRVIGYVGRLTPTKGVQNLIAACASDGMLDLHDYELWIIGDGSFRSRLQALSKHEPRIRFFGFVAGTELSRLYSEIDIFVHPGQRPEAFGRTIIEAIASRCRVVVSNLGAPPEIVEEYGVVYPHHSIRALSRSLNSLIANPRNGQVPEELLNRYSVDSVLPRIAETYGIGSVSRCR